MPGAGEMGAGRGEGERGGEYVGVRVREGEGQRKRE